jgi:ABC-type phosphate/phosphonate transport system ATPase subunit
MSDQQQVVNIRKFDVGKIQRERIILIVGKRGTGEQALLKDIFSRLPPSARSSAEREGEGNRGNRRGGLPQARLQKRPITKTVEGKER